MGLFDQIFSSGPYAKAERFFSRGLFEDAASMYVISYNANCSPVQSAFKAGESFFALGRLNEAEVWLGKAVQTDPENAKAWEHLSLTQALREKFVEAEQSARIGLDISKDHNQRFLCMMALVQALVNQIAEVGEHLGFGTAEGIMRGMQRQDLVKRTLGVIDDCFLYRPDFDEIWKFRALVGIYDLKVKIIVPSIRALKRLNSPHYHALLDEYRRVYDMEMPSYIDL